MNKPEVSAAEVGLLFAFHVEVENSGLVLGKLFFVRSGHRAKHIPLFVKQLQASDGHILSSGPYAPDIILNIEILQGKGIKGECKIPGFLGDGGNISGKGNAGISDSLQSRKNS